LARSTSKLREELLQREREYLRAVQAKDGDVASRLTARECLVVSGQGAMKVDGATIKKMVAEHDPSRRYELDESSIAVIEASDGVAIISYRLSTTANGQSSDAYDTDVWVKRDGQWKCALHAEVPAADIAA
jgi:hypothetical protein